MLLADRMTTAKNPSVELRRVKRQLNEGTISIEDVKDAATKLVDLGDPEAADALFGLVADREKPQVASKASAHRHTLRTLTEGQFSQTHIQRAILAVLVDVLDALEAK